jgi:hypothetical protein
MRQLLDVCLGESPWAPAKLYMQLQVTNARPRQALATAQRARTFLMRGQPAPCESAEYTPSVLAHVQILVFLHSNKSDPRKLGPHVADTRLGMQR